MANCKPRRGAGDDDGLHLCRNCGEIWGYAPKTGQLVEYGKLTAAELEAYKRDGTVAPALRDAARAHLKLWPKAGPLEA